MSEVVRTGTHALINKETIKCTWSGLDGDDSGQAMDLSGYPDKTVQVFGTFGSATVTLYGSNDPAVLTDRAAGTLFGAKTAEWVVAQDSLGNNIAKTVAGGDVILEDYQYWSPVVTGGTDSVLTVIIKATRSS